MKFKISLFCSRMTYTGWFPDPHSSSGCILVLLLNVLWSLIPSNTMHGKNKEPSPVHCERKTFSLIYRKLLDYIDQSGKKRSAIITNLPLPALLLRLIPSYVICQKNWSKRNTRFQRAYQLQYSCHHSSNRVSSSMQETTSHCRTWFPSSFWLNQENILSTRPVPKQLHCLHQTIPVPTLNTQKS